MEDNWDRLGTQVRIEDREDKGREERGQRQRGEID
jgi:hypothetical protein